MYKVIKSSNGGVLPGKVIGIKEVVPAGNLETDPDLDDRKQRILEQFQDNAASIIQEAEQQAQRLKEQIMQEREQWEHEKQLLIEEARKAGFEEGLQQGRNQGYEEYGNLLDEANQIVDQTKHEFVKYIEDSEKVILDLGIKTAEKILCQSIEENPERFFPIVREAVKEVRENQEIKIIIHPSKYPLIISRKDELDALMAGHTQCYVYGNEQLKENQCLVETENGRIDASTDSQLNMLHEKLLELLEGVHS
ncbi:flagellar assembly protein FliH [Bacillus sp. FJAT-49736]|uniref:flagellar assembly protein FliH n=1 Tax=Bacillus sp. FJAT-49736 TaxID=2833582 RepID=UPI001BCA3862|nr:flagellar assembly protein FliH [Bacillus sp. FJAT-49736]MBS4172516.1 flagellar assembly protein FliH [Bacillus sp. FJAT-49736]